MKLKWFYSFCSFAAALALKPVIPYLNTKGISIGINLPMVGSYMVTTKDITNKIGTTSVK